MSRTVTLLRHAKAARDDARLADIDRPLTERGRTDASRMGVWMSANGIVPDAALCSTSKRTRETLELATSGWPRAFETRFDGTLYLAEASRLLEAIRALPASLRHVLLIGHNPGCHELAVALCGAGHRDWRASLAEKFPTCGCAVITFPSATWADVAPGAGTLDNWMTPRQLP